MDVTQQLSLLATITDGPVDLDWSQGVPLNLPVEDLESEPEGGSQYVILPPQGDERKKLRDVAKRFRELDLPEPATRVVGKSEPGYRVESG